MAGLEITLNRRDQGRGFHGGDEVIEETLLDALECGARRRFGLGVQRADLAGDIGGLECGIKVVVDDLKGGRSMHRRCGSARA